MRVPILALGCLLVGALLLGGCGGGGVVSAGGDLANGKSLFVEKCSTCHTLADAGAQGTIGPNLDDAFAGSREQGFEENTFVEVVRWQIAFPGIGLGMPNQEELGLSDTEADNIASYVGRYAGNPDIPPSGGDSEITATDGAEIFAQAGCGSCHVLAAAGSTGTIGPNLDDSKPSKELVIDRVTNGQGAMPAFADRLSEEQIDAVATFVSENAG